MRCWKQLADLTGAATRLNLMLGPVRTLAALEQPGGLTGTRLALHIIGQFNEFELVDKSSAVTLS